MRQNTANQLLSVEDLSILTASGMRLLDGVTFTLEAGECLAIIGESGSGKTLTAKAVMGLCQPDFRVSGRIIFKGHHLNEIPHNNHEWSRLRGKEMTMVLQHGSSAFNPLFPLYSQIMETLEQHLRLDEQELHELLACSFSAVALPDYLEILPKYPHELSGGTLQRIMIALALMLKSELIIADEPGSNIDWISKREVLGFFDHALHDHRQALLMITHDFAEVRMLADRVLVLQKGRVVEQGRVKDVLSAPAHPYTRELISARGRLDAQFARCLDNNGVLA